MKFRSSRPLSCIYGSLGSLLSATVVWAQSSAAPQTIASQDQCLLQALKTAAADARVDQIRQQCNTAAQTPPASQAPPVLLIPLPAISPETAPAIAAPATELPSNLIPQIVELLRKPQTQQSVIERRMISEIRSSLEPFSLLPHRPNYLSPISQHRRPAGSQTTASAYEPLESHFQISFKFPLTPPLLGGQIVPFFGYTNRSWWQVYDGDRSRPFREYNHEPELFALIPASGLNLLGWEHRMSMVGFNHQSNGRDVPRSRSWNRITGEAYFDRSRHTWAALKLWYRIPEKNKVNPLDTQGDDNPDISRYMGNFEFRLGHAVPNSHNLTLMTRQSLQKNGKGALQLDWSYPMPYSSGLRFHASVFTGYGDSLIDYNNKVTRFGLGIMLKDWF